MTKVRFYCQLPGHGVYRGNWPMVAWSDFKSMGSGIPGFKVIAFDVDFPPELVKEVDVIAPTETVGVTEVRSDGE